MVALHCPEELVTRPRETEVKAPAAESGIPWLFNQEPMFCFVFLDFFPEVTGRQWVIPTKRYLSASRHSQGSCTPERLKENRAARPAWLCG